MWLIVLSDQLPIVALVSHYLTNKLIGRGPIQERPKPFPRRAYAELAVVSNRFSPLLGRFPRVTHPCATVHGPDSYGRQQWGILDKGRKPDPAMPRE